MQRRKFLIASGSLAAAGAAGLGTGAIDTISADRDLAMDVEGPGSAYLGVDANTDSSFVKQGSPVSLDFASDSGNGGSGVNERGYTEARPAFTLLNQGDDTLYIGILNSLRNNDISSAQQNNNGFTGNGGPTVPAGVDFQFIVSNNVPDFNSGSVGLIGRQNAPSPGSNYGTPSDPSTISLQAGQHAPYNFATDDLAGYVELAPGESAPVTARAIVDKGFDPSSDTVPNVPFVIEAVDTESQTRWDSNLTDELGL